MTKTEQNEFTGEIIKDTLKDVEDGFKTRLEAANYIRGYLLAAVVLGFMQDAEQKQIITDFKRNLKEIRRC